MEEIQTPQQNNRAARSSSIPFVTRFIATGFFSGYSPFAPGTAGSVVGLVLYAIPGMENPVTLAAVSIITFFIGTAAAAKMEHHLGDDPQIVVIDEIVGMWISVFMLPKRIPVAVTAFMLFRLYDIFKPPPARQSERLKNGWGIMLDDVFAALYANLTTRALLFAAVAVNSSKNLFN